MRLEIIEDPEDDRVAAYRDIREQDLTGRAGLFIAEGEVVLRSLLAPTSLCRPVSVLIAANRLARLGPVLETVPSNVPIYAAEPTVLDRIAGFPLHRGILALGQKPARVSVEAVLKDLSEEAVVVAASEIGNHDNMGGLFRNAAAFGAAAVLVDDRCADPFYRKSIRVSVGAVLRVPSAKAVSLISLIDALQKARFEVIALSPSATEPLRALRAGGRRALLLGSEGPGLPESAMRRARTVGIPMAGGFDSLNVAVTSALALYQITAYTPK